jgi:hypothetical protein
LSQGAAEHNASLQALQGEVTALKRQSQQDQRRLEQACAQRDAAIASQKTSENELEFYNTHVLGIERVSIEKMTSELRGMKLHLQACRDELAAARSMHARSGPVAGY